MRSLFPASCLLGLVWAVGCGGSSARAPSPAKPAASSAPRAGAAPGAPLGALPPMAKMPKPGVAGSRKVELRAAPPRMSPAGAPLRGSQADRDPHQEHKVHVAKGRCLRVTIDGDGAAHDLVVVARDDAGDVIAESNGRALPETGAMCFLEEGDLTLLVGVGTGKASYTLTVSSD